jgi:hypothetical protein
MFSVKQKREIADAVQKILQETKHVELPEGEVTFQLHVEGAQPWSWADIRNNGAVPNPLVNPFNEVVAEYSLCDSPDCLLCLEIRRQLALKELEGYPKHSDCPACYGTGMVIEQVCTTCSGTGKVGSR